MALFVIYTASVRPNFLTLGSFANLITQVAAFLPMALGIGGTIVLTGTDLSAGRVSGFTAAVAAVLLQKSDFANKMFPNLPKVSPLWILVTLLIAVAIGAFVGLLLAAACLGMFFCRLRRLFTRRFCFLKIPEEELFHMCCLQ